MMPANTPATNAMPTNMRWASFTSSLARAQSVSEYTRHHHGVIKLPETPDMQSGPYKRAQRVKHTHEEMGSVIAFAEVGRGLAEVLGTGIADDQPNAVHEMGPPDEGPTLSAPPVLSLPPPSAKAGSASPLKASRLHPQRPPGSSGQPRSSPRSRPPVYYYPSLHQRVYRQPETAGLPGAGRPAVEYLQL